MEQKINEIEINGITYVRKDSIQKMAPELDGMEYCMVRTESAGVFAGYIERRDGQEVVLRNARRIWFWAGAASLSQLAVDGTSRPESCKFPIPLGKVMLLEVIEIIPITEKAKKSIEEVPVWEVCMMDYSSGNGNGYGSGYGSGYGDGSGYGSGYGSGSGDIYGSGHG